MYVVKEKNITEHFWPYIIGGSESEDLSHFKQSSIQIHLNVFAFVFSVPEESSPVAEFSTSTFTPIESPEEGAVVTTEAQHEKVAFDTGSDMVNNICLICLKYDRLNISIRSERTI